MATWMAHLRLAKKVLDASYPLEVEPFLIGNVAPDAGVPDEHWLNYNPPKHISHWTGDEEDGWPQPERFFEAYIRAGERESDPERFAFLAGYYLHLIVDVAWNLIVVSPMKEQPGFPEKIGDHPDLVTAIRRDWYGQDFVYLRSHPDNIFTLQFLPITQVPDYLDYFPPGAIAERVRYIQDLYQRTDVDLDRPFLYLTTEGMDAFVEQAEVDALAGMEKVMERMP